MGKRLPERPEQKESKRRGPEAGTNLERWRKQTKARAAGTPRENADEVARTRWCGVSQDKAWYLEFILSPVRVTE